MKINFTKMVASGNDFVVVEGLSKWRNLKKLSQKMCDRKYGIGADGLLVLNKKGSGTSMRIFNADGSEAEMCGNGARCAALYIKVNSGKLFTLAGVIDTSIKASRVRIKLTDPKNVLLDIPLDILGKKIRVNFVNTGVPHTVIFVEGLKDIDVGLLGRAVRFHKKFYPAGTNVNFVELLGNDTIAIRTYERGVEGETLACGTGSTASAIIFALLNNLDSVVQVKTQSQEVLKVYFEKKGNNFKNVWLEGSAKIVYKGEYYV